MVRGSVRDAVSVFLLMPLAACGEKPHADGPPAHSQAIAPAVPSSAPVASAAPPPATAPPPRAAVAEDPAPATLTSTGEACTSDKECALLFSQVGCCSCGRVVPLTVRSLQERARESVPSKHCERVECAVRECRGLGIEAYRPVCIDHSCGAVRR